MIVTQQTTEALPASKPAISPAQFLARFQDVVVHALVVPFVVIVLHVAMPKTACRGSSAIRGTPCFNSL